MQQRLATHYGEFIVRFAFDVDTQDSFYDVYAPDSDEDTLDNFIGVFRPSVDLHEIDEFLEEFNEWLYENGFENYIFNEPT